MDLNSEIKNQPTQMPEMPETPETLTSAEMEQITAQKRDKLYEAAAKASVVFAVFAVILMGTFKINEDFFDANSRLGLLMESVNAMEANEAYPKINIKAEFDDKNESRLVLPIGAVMPDGDITVREEFTKNKLIIRLVGMSENITDGIRLTSDSRIMDAVGIYRQNLDVVVEVYCRDIYSYEVVNSGRNLTINFSPLRANYNAVAVIYMPYEDRNRLALPEWQQSIAKYASDNRIRLFMASNMQEAYTQQEMVEFAQKVRADAVIGIDVEADAGAAQTTASVICNTVYFIPEFNSAQLSVILAEAFLSELQLKISGIYEADGNTPLVYNATNPAAFIKISQPQKDADSVEAVYKLNEKIVEAIKRTLGDIYAPQ